MGSPDEHDARVMALKTECEELERRREAREAAMPKVEEIRIGEKR